MGKPLLLNGKPFQTTNRPTLPKLRAFLDDLPDNEVLDVNEIRLRSKIGQCSLREIAGADLLPGYTHSWGDRKKFFFGNPRAIESLKKLLTEKK